MDGQVVGELIPCPRGDQFLAQAQVQISPINPLPVELALGTAPTEASMVSIFTTMQSDMEAMYLQLDTVNYNAFQGCGGSPNCG